MGTSIFMVRKKCHTNWKMKGLYNTYYFKIIKFNEFEKEAFFLLETKETKFFIYTKKMLSCFLKFQHVCCLQDSCIEVHCMGIEKIHEWKRAEQEPGILSQLLLPQVWADLTLNPLTSVSIFSIPITVHFPRCWQREFI